MALATTAFADAVPGFELERFAPNPGARETLGLSTGDGLAAGSLRVSLLGHYERDPLVFTVAGVRSGAAISSRVTAHVLAAWASPTGPSSRSRCPSSRGSRETTCRPSA